MSSLLLCVERATFLSGPNFFEPLSNRLRGFFCLVDIGHVSFPVDPFRRE
jgi:hypothetical protein